jgi:accessory gene regulator B
MLNKMSKYIVESLIRNEIILSEQVSIYNFGIEALIFKVINILAILTIGLCFGMVVETITFLISFSMIRIYAGGYHAKSRLRCFMISILIIFFSLLIIKMSILQNILMDIFLLILSFLLIYIFTPSDNQNKVLDSLERLRYRRISVIILLLLELSALILLQSKSLNSFGCAILESLNVEALLILLNKPKHFKLSLN